MVCRRGAVQHVFGYDVVIDTDGKPFVLEINTHPNLDLEMSEIADPVMRQQVSASLQNPSAPKQHALGRCAVHVL